MHEGYNTKMRKYKHSVHLKTIKYYKKEEKTGELHKKKRKKDKGTENDGDEMKNERGG